MSAHNRIRTPHPDDAETPIEWVCMKVTELLCAVGFVLVAAYVYDPQLLRPLIECLR